MSPTRSRDAKVFAAALLAAGFLSWGSFPSISRADATPATQPAGPFLLQTSVEVTVQNSDPLPPQNALVQPAPMHLESATSQPATRPSADVPSTQPADPAVAALVDKLGDPDPAVRDDATKKLSEIGKSALPALKEVAAAGDPESSARARELIHHLQRRVPPSAPPANVGRSSSVRASMNGGLRTMDINDNGQKIHIVTHPDESIEMSVTGIEDGREATETYKAKNPGELQHDNPEAFALYDRWAGGHGGQGIQMHVFGGGQGRVMIGGMNGVNGGPLMPMNARPIPPEVRAQIEKRLHEANIPPEQRDQILKHLDAAPGQQQAAEQKTHDKLRGGQGGDDQPQSKPAE